MKKKQYFLIIAISFGVLFIGWLGWQYWGKQFSDNSRDKVALPSPTPPPNLPLTGNGAPIPLGVEKKRRKEDGHIAYSLVGIVSEEVYQDGDIYLLPVKTGEEENILVDLVLGKKEDTMGVLLAKNGEITNSTSNLLSVSELLPLLDKGDKIQVNIVTSWPDEWMNVSEDKCDQKCERAKYFIQEYGQQSGQFLEKIIQGEEVSSTVKLGWVDQIRLGVWEPSSQ